MEIKVLENTKKKLKFEIVGEDHTLPNLITKTLLEDPSVKHSTYTIEHPLVSNPIIIIVTDGSKTPKQALLDAISKIKSRIGEFREEFKRALGGSDA